MTAPNSPSARANASDPPVRSAAGRDGGQRDPSERRGERSGTQAGCGVLYQSRSKESSTGWTARVTNGSVTNSTASSTAKRVRAIVH